MQDVIARICADSLHKYTGICIGTFGYVYTMSPKNKQEALSQALINLFAAHETALKEVYKFIYKNDLTSENSLLIYCVVRPIVTNKLIKLYSEGVEKSTIARSNPGQLTINNVNIDGFKVLEELLDKFVSDKDKNEFKSLFPPLEAYCNRQIEFFKPNIEQSIPTVNQQIRYATSEYSRISVNIMALSIMLIKLVDIMKHEQTKGKSKGIEANIANEIKEFSNTVNKFISTEISPNAKNYLVNENKIINIFERQAPSNN